MNALKQRDWLNIYLNHARHQVHAPEPNLKYLCHVWNVAQREGWSVLMQYLIQSFPSSFLNEIINVELGYWFGDLLNYFESLAAEHLPNTTNEFACGVARIQQWLAMDKRDVTQQQFDAFLHQVEAIERPGTGYFHLWHRVCGWGYTLGLRVPEHHPWTVDTRQLLCIHNHHPETYQVRVGTHYRPVAFDTAKQQVRIRNDVGRLRWYPSDMFQHLSRPTRGFLQK